MNYEEVVKELERRGVVPTKIPSLNPMINALKKSKLLGKIDPQKVIVVAGTNGKGSTCATLSTLLVHAKKRVGLYTSPHLVQTTERFRFDNEEVTHQEFVKAYETLLPLFDEERLSHFEALTLMGVWLFYSGITRPPVEYAIFEVGMGGNWDATNAIPHHFCGITKLGVDHQLFLGKTLREIALNKFGIITPNSTVTLSPLDQELEDLLPFLEKEKGCTFFQLPSYELQGLETLKSPWGKAHLSLLGKRAAENTMHALLLFEKLGFNPQDHLEALSKVTWPGRFQKISWPKMICPLFLSGDHNEQGVQSLIEILKEIKWNKLHLVVGIGADKDLEKILSLLTNLPRTKLYLTETTLKPLPLKDVPQKWLNRASLTDAKVENILNKLPSLISEGDLVLVTGSLYLVGRVLELQRKEEGP